MDYNVEHSLLKLYKILDFIKSLSALFKQLVCLNEDLTQYTLIAICVVSCEILIMYSYTDDNRVIFFKFTKIATSKKSTEWSKSDHALLTKINTK